MTPCFPRSPPERAARNQVEAAGEGPLAPRRRAFAQPGTWLMTLADYSLTAFALLNGARVLAYLPQMIRVYRDPNGATAVSVTTWALFTAANVATISYALTVSNDWIVAGVL